MQQFWDKVETYAKISEAAKAAWANILRPTSIYRYVQPQGVMLPGILNFIVARLPAWNNFREQSYYKNVI